MGRHLLTILTCAAALPIFSAVAADEVQRQLEQRDQQQLELRLRMRQQLDRAVQPSQNPAVQLRQRQMDRDQQQRLQQSQDQEARSAVVPGPSSAFDTQRLIETRRGAEAAVEQLKRFDAERRLDMEPDARR